MLDEDPDQEMVGIFAHMITAIEVWMDRVEGIKQPYTLFPTWTLEEVQSRHEESLTRIKRIVETTPMSYEVHYKTSEGTEFCNSLGEILLHIHSHSAYHRGQIAQDIRRKGREYLDTDFIFTVRKEL